MGGFRVGKCTEDGSGEALLQLEAIVFGLERVEDAAFCLVNWSPVAVDLGALVREAHRCPVRL